ncbi:MAG: glycosyltransferase [Vicinamibacteria bacterium]
MATILLSYAAGPRVHALNQRALVESARRVGGFDRIVAHGPLPAGHPQRVGHDAVLSEAEGAGYWLWKPRIILDALEAAAPDDVVVYIDAGARLRRPLAPLIALAHRHDAVLMANDHANAPYVKRDAYVLTGTDGPEAQAARQLDASLMLWRNTEASRSLVTAWLRACEDPRALTDRPSACGLPELPSFRSHRHDQALLSLIVGRDRRAYRLAIMPRPVKYRFLEHHRRRIPVVPIALWYLIHDGPWEWNRAREREKDVGRRRRAGVVARLQGSACTMERLPDLRLYSSIDECLAFLRALPEAPPPMGPVEPVHFFWGGPSFSAKPALCLHSFLATQDERRVRPWLWLVDEKTWAGRDTDPYLAPLRDRVEFRRFDFAALAEGTPLEGAARSALPKTVPLSDFARLLCVFRHGGCYSDLDALFLRDLGPLFALAGAREFCFQWSLSPLGTNAFSRHAAGSAILRDIIFRAAAARSGHPKHLFPFDDAPAGILMLPAPAFSPLWLQVDGHDTSGFAPFTSFNDFFAERRESDPQRATLDTFFPGAFTYHWHGRWHLSEHASSFAGQLAGEIRERLLTRIPGFSKSPRYP